VIKPGGTIGILGGGQLGRMLALAAAPLGYRVHVLCPDDDIPAAQVAVRTTHADYEDPAALDAFAAEVDVVTYEFENVPAGAVERLATRVPVFPDAQALATCQDRLVEREFLARVGVPTAAFRPIDNIADVAPAIAALGAPAVLKTRRFGYDGKGQALVRAAADAEQAWAGLKAPAILEAWIDFRCEVSVVVARGRDGAVAPYVPVENRHIDHILATTIAPASIPAVLAGEAVALARRIVDALGYVGVMGVEMFVTRDGRLLINELAPRVHNSGHWTMDACIAGQFEQHIRAVTGLPLGDPTRRGDAVMRNLIGATVDDWPRYAADPSAKLHLYGKRETRAGRKMGHVTWVHPLGTPAERMLTHAEKR
jgi:5-(carboxyamino)imidazole ribonucleotide synthase